MLTSIFESSSTTDLTTILICSICSIIMGLIISFTHMKTSRYSKNFLTTIAVLPLLVQTVIIMVNGNLGTSVAILGTFSLVKFRSMPGTSKEILSVFFAMTIGLATGMGQILFAIFITVLTCIVLLILNKVKLFEKGNYEKILKITIPENLDYTTIFDELFEKYTSKCELVQVKTTNMGSMFDLTYHVMLIKGMSELDFINDLRIRNGNLKIILTHPLMESDL